MKYRVRLTDKAELDIEKVLIWFEEQGASAAGSRWFAHLKECIASLESMPERCGLAAESMDLAIEIRELLVGQHRRRYRALFQIEKQTVIVLRVWHTSRDRITEDDL